MIVSPELAATAALIVMKAGVVRSLQSVAPANPSSFVILVWREYLEK